MAKRPPPPAPPPPRFPDPAELKAALWEAKQASWRAVLAEVARWGASAREAGASLDIPSLQTLGAACLNGRSFRIALGLVDQGFLPDVPTTWLTQVSTQGQETLAVALIERSSAAALKQLEHPHMNSIGARAARAGHLAILGALAQKGVLEPWTLAVALSHKNRNDEQLVQMLPVLLNLGASPASFSPDDRFFFKNHVRAPLEVALGEGLPRMALALLDAGADLGLMVDPDKATTLSHHCLSRLGQWTLLSNANRGPWAAVLERMATHSSWWRRDRDGKRPLDRFTPSVAARRTGLVELVEAAETRATLKDVIPEPRIEVRRPRM